MTLFSDSFGIFKYNVSPGFADDGFSVILFSVDSAFKPKDFLLLMFGFKFCEIVFCIIIFYNNTKICKMNYQKLCHEYIITQKVIGRVFQLYQSWHLQPKSAKNRQENGLKSRHYGKFIALHLNTFQDLIGK